jgi:hypothetical protein
MYAEWGVCTTKNVSLKLAIISMFDWMLFSMIP